MWGQSHCTQAKGSSHWHCQWLLNCAWTEFDRIFTKCSPMLQHFVLSLPLLSTPLSSILARNAFNSHEELKGNLIESCSVLWPACCHSSLAGSFLVSPCSQAGWENAQSRLERAWWRADSWWFSAKMPGACFQASKKFTSCPEKPQKTVYRKQRLLAERRDRIRKFYKLWL